MTRHPSEPCCTLLPWCWSLPVVFLPRFLIQRSCGIPYYCEELLRYLSSNNMLLFHTGRLDKGGEDTWQSLMGKHPCCRSAVAHPLPHR